MHAQVFHVGGFQAGRAHLFQQQANVRQFAVGEDIAADEVAAAVGRFARFGVGRRDAVIHRHAAVAQEVVDLAEVRTQVVQPDMLEHADAGDLVVGLGDVTIVLQADLAAILQTGCADAPRRLVELRARERDADAARAIFLRSADDQCAPAAADVEQPFVWLQPDLVENVVDLLDLRLLQRVGRRTEIGARVDHVRVEPQPVEVVGQVVVVRDRLGIEPARMARLVQPRALGVRAERRNEAGDRVEGVQHSAFEIEIALDVGRTERGERRAHQVADGLRGLDAQDERRSFAEGFAEREAFAVPQLDRDRVLTESVAPRREQRIEPLLEKSPGQGGDQCVHRLSPVSCLLRACLARSE